MTKTHFSLAAAATVVLSSTFLFAQSAPTDAAPAPAGQVTKPSPYQGVSVPPANDSITTSEDAPVAPPAVTQAAPTPPPAAAPRASSNPDAGIIETALPPSADEYAPHSRAGLNGRSAGSSVDSSTDSRDDGIVTYVPGPANALPEGTVFRVRMLQDIDAASTTPNTPFRGTLTQDILRNGKVVVPVGSELRGRVMYATAGRRINGGSIIHLRPDEFILPDGTRYHLHAEVIDTQGSNTKPKGEGDITADEHGKRSLTEVGLGAGSGAILGAAVGGGVGAVVGTAVGAGVTTAHWLLTNWSANLPASSTVVFSLTDAMFLTPAQDEKTEIQAPAGLAR
jgi:hypothetical protein